MPFLVCWRFDMAGGLAAIRRGMGEESGGLWEGSWSAILFIVSSDRIPEKWLAGIVG